MKSPVVARSRTTARVLCAVACIGTFSAAGPEWAGPAPLAAQSTGQITGTVTAGGRGLSGANVEVMGTGRRTVTNPDGSFALAGIAPGARTLRVTAIGHAPRTVAVTVTAGAAATVTVQLTAQAVGLDSLVVVGYTTQNRRTVTDAVTSVSAEQLANRQVATIEEALRGQAAGVDVVSSGEPGRTSTVAIRGQAFLTGTGPLYVVDGMYTQQNPNLNPEDIESIEVLKDASASAQYGAQSANGVIVIRTRRGRAGAPRVNFSSYYGPQATPNRIEMVDAARWVQLAREARANASDPAIRATATQPFTPTANTNWQDAVFQGGSVQDHNFSVSGGTENATYLLGGGYFQQDGTIINTGFERYSFRVNSELRRGRFKLGQNVALSRFTRDNIVGFPLVDAVTLTPIIGVRNGTGYGYGAGANTALTATFGTNPVGAFEREFNRDISNRVLGNVFGELRLIGGLSYRLNAGIDYEDLNWRQFIGLAQIRQNTTPDFNQGTDRQDNTSNLLFENLLSFNGGRGEHSLNAVAGVTQQSNRRRRVEAYGTDFPDETIREISAATANLDNATYTIPSTLIGYLFRANYSYADRFLVTGTFRRDGSSRFGPRNKWGNYASGSVGYVVSEEDFFDRIPLLGRAVGYMKLRASYGTLGNQDIGDFEYLPLIIGSQAYPFAGRVQTGSTQIGLADPNIQWQEQRQGNIGVDFSVLDNSLELTADYYRTESREALLVAPIPPSLGSGWTDPVDNTFNNQTPPPTTNAASVRNSGFELGARYTLRRGDMRMVASANLMTIHNEVTSLGNREQPLYLGFANVARTDVGGSIGEFFVVRTDGIFQSDAEVQAHRNSKGQVIQPNAKPGDVRYLDLNDDGHIGNEDRQVAGSPIPDFQGGFSLDATYRRVNLGVSMRGSYGAEIFNVARYWNERGDENANFRAGYNPWRPDNTNTDDPRLVFGPEGADNARANSDRWLEDGSFLRFQNVVLGYELPPSLTRRFGAGLDRTRVYLNLQNAYTFTGYSNWDPEVRGGEDALVRGIDDGRIYPNPRSLTIGVDLSL